MSPPPIWNCNSSRME